MDGKKYLKRFEETGHFIVVHSNVACWLLTKMFLGLGLAYLIASLGIEQNFLHLFFGWPRLLSLCVCLLLSLAFIIYTCYWTYVLVRQTLYRCNCGREEINDFASPSYLLKTAILLSLLFMLGSVVFRLYYGFEGLTGLVGMLLTTLGVAFLIPQLIRPVPKADLDILVARKKKVAFDLAPFVEPVVMRQLPSQYSQSI